MSNMNDDGHKDTYLRMNKRFFRKKCCKLNILCYFCQKILLCSVTILFEWILIIHENIIKNFINTNFLYVKLWQSHHLKSKRK